MPAAPAAAAAPAEAASLSLNYAKLTRQQKLAVFLIVIGPESASLVLKQFTDHEVEMLCREMGTINIVPDSVRAKALEEFSPIVGESVISTLGGFGYARQTLGLARGDHKANSILSRVGLPPGGSAQDIIREIAEMDSRQIYNLLKEEQAQTVAFVLSYLDSSKAAEVFTLFTMEQREEIVERLGTIDSTSVELVGRIVRSLGKHFDHGAKPTLHRSGGVRAVADLLNGLDKAAAKSLLTRLEERNAQLGADVRKKMFSFEDLIRLQATDLQRVLREVDSANLAISMKGASEPMKEKIFGAISKRAAEGLRDEISMLGPVRLKDVEIAQDAVIQAVRRLEEEGSISLDGEGAGVVN